MIESLVRIYRYRENHKSDLRNYTYVANLTAEPIYVSYLGRRGLRLPGLTEDSEPILCYVKQAKGMWKRKKNAILLDRDMNEKKILILGDYNAVKKAINKANGVPEEEETEQSPATEPTGDDSSEPTT